MGSDRARVSYDESRQYRSVVMQQGRVTVEADWNEAQLISSEEERKEVLDIVGPAGTPDDGYRVLEPGTAPTPPFDFTVGAGTMYVGGLRSSKRREIVYSKQSEWLDHSTDPDWIDPALPNDQTGHEEVYLLLREQEVSAVEDTVLREVALGGPDTAQRTRLIQHIVRSPADASTCKDAGDVLAKKWAAEGLTPDYDTMRLKSSATLHVNFPDSNKPPDPCEPAATGGYLGADNQLIRVQISSDDGKGNYKFVWGFDDASFLYRVQALDSQNLKLQSSPVDQYHQPRTGQAVEVLRSAAKLDANDYVASATGIVSKLAVPYNSDLKTVTLPSALPASYLDANSTPVVFLRVWEEEKAVVPGTKTDLGTTGMQVTLKAPGDVFHVGDFWLIAVRPSTPTKVYPQRFLDAPQPPDGPRLWFCPLAVIAWKNGILNVLEDCRNPFDNLVELSRRKLGGCCTVTVQPGDIKSGNTLQSIVDKFIHQEKVVICLMPGVYELDAPLRLGSEHSNLTIEACHDGAVLRAAAGKENSFIDGLIVLTRANNVSLLGLRFDLPQVPFLKAGGKLANLDSAAARKVLGSSLDDLMVSIAVRPVHCAVLTIQNCLFRFSLTENRDVFGVGIFASSECWGFHLSGCRFVHEEAYLRNQSRPFRLLVGYVLMPTITFKIGADPSGRVAKRVGTFTRTILNDARIEENLFSGLTLAALVTARTGLVAIENNTVRDCYAGFWLLSMASLAFATSLNQIEVNKTFLADAQEWLSVYQSAAQDPIIVVGSSIARSYPMPAEFTVISGLKVESAAAAAKDTKKPSQLQGVVNQLMDVFHQTGATTDAAVKETTTKARATTKQAANTVPLTDPAAPAADPGTATDSTLRAFQDLNLQLSNFAQTADQGAVVNFALTLSFTANEVDARIDGAFSNACLLVIGEDVSKASVMTMTGNVLRNIPATRTPTAAIILVERCAITGNIVINELPHVKEPRSLALFPGGNVETPAKVAITGNVFQGQATLPARPVTNPPTPSPMDTWSFFNSETR